MLLLARLASIALLIVALRGKHWAYAAFVVISLLYIPAQAGFRFSPPSCELAPSLRLIVFSLQNHAHIVLFAAFYGLSWVQFRAAGWAGFAWAGVATLLMGALLEIVQAVTGRGHCRIRDLLPDLTGGLLASLLLALWYRRRGQPSRREAAVSGGAAVA